MFSNGAMLFDFDNVYAFSLAFRKTSLYSLLFF